MTNAEQIREVAWPFATIDLHTETQERSRIQQTGRNRPTRKRVGPPVLLPFDQHAAKWRESQSGMIKILRRHPLAFILVASLMSFPSMHAWGREPVVEVSTQNAMVSTADQGGVDLLSRFPVNFSLAVNGGYDANFRTSGAAQGSWFTNEGVTLSYNLPNERTPLRLRSGADLTYYPDQASGQTNRVNAYLDLSLTHNISSRLKLDASVYATYRAEPDFTSDVGPSSVQGNYFNMLDSLSAAYNWSLRFSTVTSGTFRLVQYEQSSVGTFQNRFEDTIGQEFRFSLSPRDTVLAGKYRFTVIDYESLPRDSTTHFVLVGVDQGFSPQLKLVVRGGLTFRSYSDGGSQTNPNFESSLGYAGAHNLSLSWTTRYGIEAPSLPNAFSRTTARTGLQLTYDLSARITATVNGSYRHDENQGLNLTGTVGPAFSADAFDVSVGVRYALNRRFTFNLNYQYSEVTSSNGGQANYTRNRYSAGLNFNY